MIRSGVNNLFCVNKNLCRASRNVCVMRLCGIYCQLKVFAEPAEKMQKKCRKYQRVKPMKLIIIVQNFGRKTENCSAAITI